MPEPGDAIAWREAGAILGVGMRQVGKLVAKGQLSRGPRWQHRQLSRVEVEALALRRWNPRTAGPNSYWLGTREAAELLGVYRARVRQLVAAGLLPFEQTPRGYAFRREQLLTVANARRARFHAYARRMRRPFPAEPHRSMIVARTNEPGRTTQFRRTRGKRRCRYFYQGSATHRRRGLG
jgi:excisionase family DNA binding protein